MPPSFRSEGCKQVCKNQPNKEKSLPACPISRSGRWLVGLKRHVQKAHEVPTRRPQHLSRLPGEWWHRGGRAAGEAGRNKNLLVQSESVCRRSPTESKLMFPGSSCSGRMGSTCPSRLNQQLRRVSTPGITGQKTWQASPW